MKHQARDHGKIVAGQRALLLWKQFLDRHRKPNGEIGGIEFLPQAIEGIYWECLFCGSMENEEHAPDCPLIAAIELVDEVFGETPS